MKKLFAARNTGRSGLVLGLLAISLSAPAQTALIAHRSHGGTARTFVAAHSVDNFGVLPIRPTPVKIVYLQGAQVVRYSEAWRAGRQIGRTRVDTVDIRRLTGQYDPTGALAQLRQLYPKAELVGFEQKKIRETWPSKD